MRKITKRSAIIATAAVVVVGGAGAAFAAWSLNSSASVSTTAGSAAPLQVSSQTVVGTLLPGSKNDVSFFAHNPNNFPVKITGISYSEVTVDGNHSACGINNLVQVAPSAPLPANVSFAKQGDPGDNQSITWASSIRLVPDPQTECQGAQFGFKINLTVVSDTASS